MCLDCFLYCNCSKCASYAGKLNFNLRFSIWLFLFCLRMRPPESLFYKLLSECRACCLLRMLFYEPAIEQPQHLLTFSSYAFAVYNVPIYTYVYTYVYIHVHCHAIATDQCTDLKVISTCTQVVPPNIPQSYTEIHAVGLHVV